MTVAEERDHNHFDPIFRKMALGTEPIVSPQILSESSFTAQKSIPNNYNTISGGFVRKTQKLTFFIARSSKITKIISKQLSPRCKFVCLCCVVG